MKLTRTALAILIATHTHVAGKIPASVRVAPKIKSWQAEALSETPRGYLIVGQQKSTGNTGQIIVSATDPVHNTSWTRSLGTGTAGGIETVDGQHAVVSGSQGGLAKIWKINTALKGRVEWQAPLDSGLARSVKNSPDRQLFVTIEHGSHLKIKRLDPAGKMIWEKKLPNEWKAKSNLLVSREGYVVVAYGGHGLALDSCGNIFWKHRSEATQWNGLFQRKNGEIVFFGHQKIKLFGPCNDEAFLMSVRPVSNSFEWFRSFGKDTSFDSGCAVAEQRNGCLLLLARQDERFRLIELLENHTIAQVKWLTDSPESNRMHCLGLIRGRPGTAQWKALYNHPNGSVWLRPVPQGELR